MTVPSYADLTPGIPGVVDSETVDQLALFLREDRQRRPGAQEVRGGPGSPPSPTLFACLRLQASPPAHPLTAAGGQRLADVARDFSPRVRRVGECEVLLDVSGLGRLVGPPPDIARQLARALADAGVTASVALAPTQTMARVLAHASDPGDHEHPDAGPCDLCDRRCTGSCGRGPWPRLPVEFLRELEALPPGIAHRDRARLYDTIERWGIATLGELAALPAADLSSRLGRRGLALQRFARGLDPAPFVPDGDTPRYVGRLELDWPIDALEPLSFVFARLLEPLSAALERADRGAAAVRLDLRLTDRSTHTRVLPLPAAMRDARVLRTLLLLDLESAPPPAAVDVVGIELDPAPARITQFSLLQRALPSPETLATLTARLSALAGESRVGSPALLDSHRPDAFVMTRYAPDAAGAANDSAAGESGAARAQGAVLRRERRAVALRVSVERGRPVHIAASRRGIPHGAIAQASGPWRTSGGWWLAAVSPKPHGGEGGWSRNEWDVALTSGAVCRIFEDRTTARWFLDGLYD